MFIDCVRFAQGGWKKQTYSPNGGETWCIITGQIPQNDHTFVLFDPPKMGPI